MTNISAAMSRIQSIQNTYEQVTAVAQGGFQDVLDQAIAQTTQTQSSSAPEFQSVQQGTGAPRAAGKTAQFLEMALSQKGKTYIYGAEADGQVNPKAFDCSELIQWAMERLGMEFPDGSANQIAYAKPISVEEALRTPGALLYRPGHIAISLGNGKTMEARGSDYGVGVFSARDRGWTAGGLIPELSN
jgi:cell wall-associated NlpC family hydrolase